ncbi:hypothetical protein [Mycoplasmopsis columboralis]|uniref:Uncharacterized protein n=1 Tax=Mycoplasmopsis columboralis TaxID=171282 RepID=A0A449B5T7_9BACT|nr:hypothetical protein [Mycoplasmopsis columboralis]VEU75971.1 Uncharacterised protein [Mycoplasmopsis columboralis]
MKSLTNLATDIQQLYAGRTRLRLTVKRWVEEEKGEIFFNFWIDKAPRYFFSIVAPYEGTKEIAKLKNWRATFVDFQKNAGFKYDQQSSEVYTCDILEVLKSFFDQSLEKETYKAINQKIKQDYKDIKKWIGYSFFEIVPELKKVYKGAN